MPDNNSVEKIPQPVEQSISPENPESEVAKSPEKAPEQVAEQPEDAGSQPVAQVQLPDDQPANTHKSIDEVVLHQVENILSEGMDKVFLDMDAATQQQFKLKGEETAQKIATLLRTTKVKIKEVISLIVDWLRVIPRVNKYYLEQEAKIKADAIMKVHKNKNG